MKSSEMLLFLEQTMKVHGDVDIIVEVNDYSDCYNVKTTTGKIDRVTAKSELTAVSSSEKISALKEIRLVTNIGR